MSSRLFFDIFAEDKTAQAFNSFGRRLTQTEAKIKRFGDQAVKVGAAFSAVGAGLGLAVRGQLKSADEIGKAANRLSVPVEELQRLSFAAGLGGAGLSELETAITGLSRRMVDQPDAFGRLGVEVRDAAGEMRPTVDVLSDLADAFAGMEGAERTAAAMETLGRSGSNLLPMLEGGSDGLRALGDEAERMGLVMGADAIKAAEEFNDTMSRITGTMSGLVSQLTVSLLPALQTLADGVQRAAEMFHDLSPEMQNFLGIAGGTVLVIGPAIAAFGLLALGIGAVGLKVAAIATALGLAAAALAAFWPKLVEWKNRVFEAVADAADAFWSWVEAVRGAVGQAAQAAIDAFQGWVDWVAALPAEMVRIAHDIIEGFRDGIVGKFNEIRDSLTAPFRGFADNVRAFFRTQSPSRLFMDIGRDLMDGLRIGIADNMTGPVGQMETLADSLAGAWDNFASSLINNFGDIRSALSGLAQDLAQTFARNALNIGFSALGIPGFANGTSFAPGGLAMVGERGPELVNLPRGSRVTPASQSRGMSGGAVRVVVEEGPMFAARVRTEAQGVAVNVTRAGLQAYDRTALPGRVAQINKDPRRRG